MNDKNVWLVEVAPVDARVPYDGVTVVRPDVVAVLDAGTGRVAGWSLAAGRERDWALLEALRMGVEASEAPGTVYVDGMVIGEVVRDWLAAQGIALVQAEPGSYWSKGMAERMWRRLWGRLSGYDGAMMDIGDLALGVGQSVLAYNAEVGV